MSPAPELRWTCRESRPTDAIAIREILEESHLSSLLVSDIERATREPIGEILALVCERDARPAGVLQWRHLGPEVEIVDLAVRPKHRRQGCATSLLRHFLGTIAGSGVAKVFLEVRESNAAAVALYQKFGFQITGRRPKYYRDPQEAALLMACSFPD